MNEHLQTLEWFISGCLGAACCLASPAADHSPAQQTRSFRACVLFVFVGGFVPVFGLEVNNTMHAFLTGFGLDAFLNYLNRLLGRRRLHTVDSEGPNS